MRNTLERKLRSNRGMTLILSLLLFLICAAVGSVALTAGTASSGTISERAKLDQRYFSVTSAAELLRKTFDGKSVTVTVERDEENHWTGSDVSPERDGANAEWQFIIDQSLCLLSALGDSDWQYASDRDTLRANADSWLTLADAQPYAVTASSDDMSDGELDALNATIAIDRENGRPEELDFVVTSDIDNQKFSLKIKCAASVLKEVRTTASGQEIEFQVEWKIGDIRLAD